MKESVKKHIAKHQTTLGAKSSTYTYTYKLEWDGDNVKKLKGESNNGEYYAWTDTYTYDKKSNPFYRSLSEDDNWGCLKNNVTKVVYENSDGDYEEYSYTYKYDGKFPIERTSYGEDGYYSTYFYEYEE